MEQNKFRFLCCYGVALVMAYVLWYAQFPALSWWFIATTSSGVGHSGGSVCAAVAGWCAAIWGAASVIIPLLLLRIAQLVYEECSAETVSRFVGYGLFFLSFCSMLCQHHAIYVPGVRCGGIIGFYAHALFLYGGVSCRSSLVEYVLILLWSFSLLLFLGTDFFWQVVHLCVRGIYRWVIPPAEYMWYYLYTGVYTLWHRATGMCVVGASVPGVSTPEASVMEASVRSAVSPVERKVSRKAVADVEVSSEYRRPSLERVFGTRDTGSKAVPSRMYESQAHILEEKLAHFGIRGKVTSITIGPVVVLFEYQPESNVPVNKIVAREHDLALALQAITIRIIAPIPGKSVVGFECARSSRDAVLFADHWSELLAQQKRMRLPLLIGVTTVGVPVILDLAGMPHLLVAGSTGSGKSVALNSMIVSLLSMRTPQEMRLILIDPKRLEFAWYADLAHLLFPVITDPREAVMVLRWTVTEMERRYGLLASAGVTNTAQYRDAGNELPDIVVVIDEWADLMMSGGKDAEQSLVRLAQMARAAGIHVIVATQRPSVDVITGLIKVNVPVRIACKVISKVDSRTILDASGAESLIGKGDMLMMFPGKALERIHGVYITHQEIQEITCAIRRQGGVAYVDYRQSTSQELSGIAPEDVELYHQVLNLVRSMDEISISLLQRKLRIGYNRSARMIDYLESHGMILPSDGGKTRRIVR